MDLRFRFAGAAFLGLRRPDYKRKRVSIPPSHSPENARGRAVAPTAGERRTSSSSDALSFLGRLPFVGRWEVLVKVAGSGGGAELAEMLDTRGLSIGGPWEAAWFWFRRYWKEEARRVTTQPGVGAFSSISRARRSRFKIKRQQSVRSRLSISRRAIRALFLPPPSLYQPNLHLGRHPTSLREPGALLQAAPSSASPQTPRALSGGTGAFRHSKLLRIHFVPSLTLPCLAFSCEQS